MTKIRDLDQLLDVAAKVFAEKGFDAARLEDIAAELGVLQGSLYYHVASKADLLFLVQRRRLLDITARIECIATSEMAPLDKLATALREHLRHIDEFWPESAQWFTEPTPRHSDENRANGRALNRAYLDVIEEIVHQGVDAGDLRCDLDVPIATRGMLGMCNWVPRWYRKGGRLSMGEIGETLISLAIDGLRSRP